MAAAINFFAGENFLINDLSGSGLGFYGNSGFGSSVQVGSWQDQTWITNSLGTIQGPQVDNVKFHNTASGFIGGSAQATGLLFIPNYLSTLNIRFTFDTPVQVQNWKAQGFDRSNPNNAPSGVTLGAAEVIHPDNNQVGNGSGDSTWSFIAGSSVMLTLANSPGVSGLHAGNGSNSTKVSTQHDVYVALTASPTSIGSKTQFGLYTSLEYF